MNARHVVITGMPGVGKTTVSRLVAGNLGLTVSDSDIEIESRYGMTGHDLAARRGIDALHRAEAAVLRTALAIPHATVVAAAGSVIDDQPCRDELTANADLFVLIARIVDDIATGTHRRPLSTNEQAALLARRLPLWTKTAKVLRIDHETTPPDHVAASVLDALGQSMMRESRDVRPRP